MGLPKVNKFLFCATLETGGLIIGWVMTLISVLLIAYAGLIILSAVVIYNAASVQDEWALAIFLIVVIIFAFYMLFWVIYLTASIFLIIGTRNRDHTKLMLIMILLVIGVIVIFIQIFFSGIVGIMLSLLLLFTQIYFFFCVYSLYDKFRNERMNNVGPGQPHNPYPPQTTIVYTQQQPVAFVSTSQTQPDPSAPPTDNTTKPGTSDWKY